MRCNACDAYSSDGGPVNYDDIDLAGCYTASAPAVKARYGHIFDDVGRQAAPGRFLDIGARMGFSLEVAGEYGWSGHGLEPNRAQLLNVLCRRDMAELAHGVGLEVLPARFHHNRVFDNAAFRTFGLVDGRYFMKTRGEPR